MQKKRKRKMGETIKSNAILFGIDSAPNTHTHIYLPTIPELIGIFKVTVLYYVPQ